MFWILTGGEGRGEGLVIGCESCPPHSVPPDCYYCKTRNSTIVDPAMPLSASGMVQPSWSFSTLLSLFHQKSYATATFSGLQTTPFWHRHCLLSQAESEKTRKSPASLTGMPVRFPSEERERERQSHLPAWKRAPSPPHGTLPPSVQKAERIPAFSRPYVFTLQNKG